MAEAKKKAGKAATKAKKEAELTAETVVEKEAPEVVVETEVKEEKPKATAKAGKRSAKALAEAEEKEAKEERKAEAKEAESGKKTETAKKPPRSRTERAGKKYRQLAKKIDKDKIYGLKEALELAVATSPVKFDATVEMHVNLNVDPRQADQNVRDNVLLPAGTGKDIRVATLADDSDAEKLFAQLDKEEVDFDVLVAAPTMMPKLGKYARLLGPRGLMPNPKSGTVTADITKAVTEAKAGKVEYRVDQAGIVHLGIGKVSFGADKLTQNAEAVTASIRAAKPGGLKGSYVKAAYISTSMGPSIKFDLA